MLFLFLVVVLWVRKKLPTFPTDPDLEGLKKPSEGWKILKDCSHEKSKSISSYRRSRAIAKGLPIFKTISLEGRHM